MPDPTPTPRSRLDAFLRKFTSEVAASARATLRRMRALLPGAIELVYDNYNALAIGFGPSERPSQAIVSIAVYPRWVSLFFLQWRPDFPDPEKLLRGSGKKVRHIVLAGPETLDDPAVRALLARALERAQVPLDPSARRRIVIRSVSTKQRPRRPA